MVEGGAEAAEVAEEYRTALEDLTQNSKPHINMLTMLAEENAAHATVVVKAIDSHIHRVEKTKKLPALYLIDSIVKNYKKGDCYKLAFQRRIIPIFLHVFQNSDEKQRASLYKLRWTWKDYFASSKLYGIDIKVHEVDANWPVAPIEPTASSSTSSESAKIHVNPHFIPAKGRPSDRNSRDPRARADPRRPRADVGFLDEPTADVSSTNRSDPRKRVGTDSGTQGHLVKVGKVIAESRSSPSSKDVDLRHGSSLPLKKRKDRETRGSTDGSQSSDVDEPSAKAVKKEDEDLRRAAAAAPSRRRPTIAPTSQPGNHAFETLPNPPRNGPLLANAAAMPQPHSRSGGLLPAPDAHWTPGPSSANHQPLPTPMPATVVTNVEAGPAKPIPANNRIYVDGRAYEVQYVDDTPVIERNGLPHKIYFTGPPHDVVIDGIAHSLAFGERKTISIDGQPHMIRFGAPSRELYMGTYAFRGAFGGPPIYATINGHKHEISLCGPPPEVKIEPEPAHELMKFLNANAAQYRGPFIDYTAQQVQSGAHNAVPQPLQRHSNFSGYQSTAFPATAQQPMAHTASAPNLQPAPAPKIDLMSLLNDLKDKGILDNLPKAPEKAAEAVAEPEKQREMTPPIQCQYHFGEDEVVERRSAPPSNLKDFSIRILRIRFDSVIDALYSQGGQRCPNCGLRFQHLTKGEQDSRYKAHLDWHFRENNSKASQRGRSRHWFYAQEDWVQFSEFQDVAAKTKSAFFEAQGATQVAPGAAPPSPALADHPPVVVRPDTPAACRVCSEVFEREWDDEEEYWTLKDAVEMDGNVFHAACIADLTAVNSSTLNTSAAPDDPTMQPFLPTSGESSGSVLPGLSTLKAEVKEEPLEPLAYVNSSAHPIVIDEGAESVIPEASMNAKPGDPAAS